jgi:hypothetical protein
MVFKRIDYNNNIVFADIVNLFSKEEILFEDIINWAKNSIYYIGNNGKPFWVIKGRTTNGIEPIMVNKITDPYFKEKITYIKDDKKIKSTIEDIIKKNILNCYCETREFIPYADKNPFIPEIDVYNSFDGFNYKYDENFENNEKKIKYILNHIKKVLAADNKKSYEYLLNWMAHIVQNPKRKTGVCNVFISEQRTGKNIFFEWFGKNIIGKKYYLCINNINNLINRFNSETADKLFTILDEMQMYDRNQRFQDQLKSIITQSQTRIENKGMEPFLTNDYNNFVMFTNNDNPVNLDNSDKRYAMFNVSSCYKGNEDYYNKLAEELKNEEKQEIFYHFLLNRDLSNFNPERDIPKNSLKTKLQVDSSNITTRYMIDIVRTDIANNPIADIMSEMENKFEVNKLYESMKIWHDNCCSKEKLPSLNIFSRQLSKIMSKAINLNGKKVYILNKKIISKALCNFFSIENIDELYDNEFIYDSGYESDNIIEEQYPLPTPIFEDNENNDMNGIQENYENNEVIEENIIIPIDISNDKYKCKINNKIEYGTKSHLEKRLKHKKIPVNLSFNLQFDPSKICLNNNCDNFCYNLGNVYMKYCKPCIDIQREKY